MKLDELVAVSRAVAETPARKEKVARLAELLARLAPEERALGIAFLSGEVPGGKLGVGPALVHDCLGDSTPGAESIELVALQGEPGTLRARRWLGRGSRGGAARALRTPVGARARVPRAPARRRAAPGRARGRDGGRARQGRQGAARRAPARGDALGRPRRDRRRGAARGRG